MEKSLYCFRFLGDMTQIFYCLIRNKRQICKMTSVTDVHLRSILVLTVLLDRTIKNFVSCNVSCRVRRVYNKSFVYC